MWTVDKIANWNINLEFATMEMDRGTISRHYTLVEVALAFMT